jgi:hypothetical protein
MTKASGHKGDMPVLTVEPPRLSPYLTSLWPMLKAIQL